MNIHRIVAVTVFLLLLGVSAQAQLTFTTIDVPGAGYTSVQGMNTAADLVGYYADYGGAPTHAFLYRAGTFTFFDYPGADSTVATAINDSGLIAGYADFGATVKSFLYDGTTFTDITAGNRSDTTVWGMNNLGDLVGGAGTIYSTQGFAYRGGRFKKIAPPGSYVYVYSTGVNDSGAIVGWFTGDVDIHAFLYNHGVFTKIDFPGSTQTEAWDINDNGVVVGWYWSATYSGDLGFTLGKGHYSSFWYPSAKYTVPRAINLADQTAGDYSFDGIVVHGFVASATSGDR